MPINNRVRSLRFEQAGLDKTLVDRATTWVSVENLGLVERHKDTGEIQDAQRTNKAASLLIPMAIMMLMFMVVMVGAQPLMQGVLEEKMQRIAEVLLGSVSPFQLMAGKLLGVVGVSLTLVTLYLVAGVFSAEYAGYGDLVPRHLVWWFIVYQILAVFLFGAMFSAVGAACSDLKEAQSAFMPVWIVACIPLFVWITVVREPMSTFSLVISLFPPATPMLMLVRQAAAPTLPIWQPLLGVGLTLATTILCVFAAGRIFRVGLLMQGKGANLRQMVRWALRG
jgi:ABC-2 type transport system permease protein